MSFRNPARKSVVKYLSTPTVKVFNPAQFAGRWHWHCCTNQDCRQVYYDTCHTPAVNDRCRRCALGQNNIYDAMRLPLDCCYGNTELLVDQKWIEWLELAGPGPWYQCRTCKRAHGWPLA